MRHKIFLSIFVFLMAAQTACFVATGPTPWAITNMIVTFGFGIFGVRNAIRGLRAKSE